MKCVKVDTDIDVSWCTTCRKSCEGQFGVSKAYAPRLTVRIYIRVFMEAVKHDPLKLLARRSAIAGLRM